MPNEENMAMAAAVSASTPLERAQEQLHDARLRRADYFMRLGTTANHNGTIYTYNQNGLNRIDAEILSLSRRASSLLPPAPHGEAVKSKAPSYNNKPVKERVPRKEAKAMAVPNYNGNKNGNKNANKSRAPLNSNWNTNTMNLSRVNSSLFSYNTPKAPSYNNAKAMAVPNYNGNKNGNNNANKNANKTRATRKNRKNRRSTRKN